MVDGNGNELDFLDILSLASSIVWFKSIMDSEKRGAHLNQDLGFLREHLFAVEDKVDTILNILQEK